MRHRLHGLMLAAASAVGTVQAAEPAAQSAAPPVAAAYDAALAQRTGADERGMRR